jgi:hypothetical protein
MFFIDYHQLADNRQLLFFYKKWANVLNKFELSGLNAVVAFRQTINGIAFLLYFKPKRSH